MSATPDVPLSASLRQSGVVLGRSLIATGAGETGLQVLPYYSVLKMAAFGGSEWVYLRRGDQTDVIDNDGFYQCYGQN